MISESRPTNNLASFTDIVIEKIEHFGSKLNIDLSVGSRKLKVQVTSAELLSPRRFAAAVLSQDDFIFPDIPPGMWRTMLARMMNGTPPGGLRRDIPC